MKTKPEVKTGIIGTTTANGKFSEQTVAIKCAGLRATVRQNVFSKSSNSAHLDGWGTFYAEYGPEEIDALIALLKEMKRQLKVQPKGA